MNKIVNVLNGDYEPISYSKNYVEQVILEKDNEIERLNNIINELEKWLKSQNQPMPNETVGYNYVFKINISKVLDKLKELKGSEK